jgi:hypothetical protein
MKKEKNFMPIYVTPEDAKHEVKTNIQSEVQTAKKSETYTKEEVLKMLEAIQKEDK